MGSFWRWGNVNEFVNLVYCKPTTSLHENYKHYKFLGSPIYEVRSDIILAFYRFYR